MDPLANLAIGAVLTAPSPATSGGTLTLVSGQGARFPSPPFQATVWPAGVLPDPANAEIVRVTGIATDVLTITRAQEGTAARVVIAGDLIALTITKKLIDDLAAGITAAGLSGPVDSVNSQTGAVVLAAGDVAAAPTSRAITAGTGLTGGGTLAADRTLAVAYGSTAGTATQGNDSRLSDARTPTAHASTHASGGSDPVTLAQSQITGLAASLAGKADTSRLVSAGTGLTGGGDLSADRSLAVAYGSTSGTAAQGNDSRLSDARTPTAHSHTTQLAVTFTIAGILATGTGQERLYNDSGITRTITQVRASVGSASAGTAVIADVNLNDTTIFTTQANRPSVAAGARAASLATPDVTAWTNGSYLTVDVDQVGSSPPGTTLVVTIYYTEASS